MKCPKCSSEIPPNFKFCGICGEKLDDAPPKETTPQEPRIENPSPSTVEYSDPESLRAPRDERRDVAVLFADVSGFTAMSERLDPEEVHSIMNEVFEILGQAIHEEDGYIDKYIGDNIMALFGAPIAHEDDAERACRTALAMQRVLKDFAEQCKQKTGIALRMRVGINCGLVFAGNIGSDFRRDYSVMGDTVNLASRMESKAPLGGILVTEEVVKRVRGKFEFGKFQTLQVKGKDKQVRACVLLREIIDAVPSWLRNDFSSPFLGREGELSQLLDHWRTAYSQGRWIEVIGPMGIGKSRLVWESNQRYEGGKLLTVMATPNTNLQPFGLIQLLIREVVREIQGSGATIESRDHFRVLINQFGNNLEPYLNVLWYLYAPRTFAVPAPDPDPQSLRRTLEAGVKRLLEELSSRLLGVTLFFDSYDLADEASSSLMEKIAGEPEGWPLPVVIALREEKPEPIQFRKVVRLNRLSQDSAGELLDHLVRGAKLPNALREDVLTRAEGVPLYLEEMIPSLIDEGILKPCPEGGNWTCDPKATSVTLPSSLFATMVSRLDGLQRPQRDLLCRCAVQGVEFDSVITESIWSAPEPSPGSVRSLLVEMESRGLVECRLKTDPHGSAWIFRQPLMRDACYQNLPISERRDIHAHIAGALRERDQGEMHATSELLAYHYEQAVMFVQAAEANLYAGKRAAELFLNDEAMRRFEKALELISGMGNLKDEGIRIQTQVYAGAAEISLRVGNYAEAVNHAHKMGSVAVCPIEIAEARRLQGNGCVNMGQTEKAQKLFLDAFELISDQPEAVEVKGRILYDLAEFFFRAGKMIQAKDYLGQYRAGHYRDDQLNSIRADMLEGKIAHAQGRFSEAIDLYSQAHGIADKVHSLSDLANACNSLGNAERDSGEYKLAKDHFHCALEMWTRMGHTECIAGIHVNLGNLEMSQGMFDMALDHYKKSLKAFREIGNIRGMALTQINLSILAIEENRCQIAVESAEAALKTLGDSDNALLRGMAFVILGEAHIACEDLENANQVFGQILKDYEKDSHSLAIAGAVRGLGRVALLKGELQEAITHLENALNDFEHLNREQEAARTALYRAEALWRSADSEITHSDLLEIRKRFEVLGANLDAKRVDQLMDKIQKEGDRFIGS